MTSTERREGRYQRRKAQRDAAKEEKLGKYDDFERVADVDNLYYAFTRCMRGVSWKESVQRYEANALKNVYETSQKLRLGQSVQSAFVAFTLRERGKTRLIKSIHISERVVQKCLCDQVLVPILSNCLIHDNGASVKGKGVHFALRRLIAHLAKFYRHNKSNQGYALQIDFTKFFDSVDHKVLYSLLGRKIKDPRVRSLIKNFVGVFGDGKSLGLGSQISQIYYLLPG